MTEINWDDFAKVEIRVGTIVEASPFPEARQPAYKLKIDLGSKLGIKKSSAQITHHYALDELVGKQVVCVTNFPPKQIGPYVSEVLTTGFVEGDGIILCAPERKVPNGTRLF